MKKHREVQGNGSFNAEAAEKWIETANKILSKPRKALVVRKSAKKRGPGQPRKVNNDEFTGRFRKGNVANFKHGGEARGAGIILGSTKNAPSIKGARAIRTKLLQFKDQLTARFGDKITPGQEIQVISVVSLLEKIWIIDLYFRSYGIICSKISNVTGSLTPQPVLKQYIALHNSLRLGLGSLGIDPGEIEVLTPYELIQKDAREKRH